MASPDPPLSGPNCACAGAGGGAGLCEGRRRIHALPEVHRVVAVSTPRSAFLCLQCARTSSRTHPRWAPCTRGCLRAMFHARVLRACGLVLVHKLCASRHNWPVCAAISPCTGPELAYQRALLPPPSADAERRGPAVRATRESGTPAGIAAGDCVCPRLFSAWKAADPLDPGGSCCVLCALGLAYRHDWQSLSTAASGYTRNRPTRNTASSGAYDAQTSERSPCHSSYHFLQLGLRLR